ncbi:hypothetical protein CDA63_18120 [Hymenobacter amundsenii]|uniref:Carboxypeptidase-like regulatory domain-containing protein n=1 Tax=Hymenobacter amundsenii TaxID=2006685 RepID=A0A246FGP3_9BACT|nr:carboxypeptidase-like regulatory domain-containing protein [Hymenobacter amundsenii]OWP61699.1 hypothetical protein CDA63_18120 [Hymenobacter amundsenii]
MPAARFSGSSLFIARFLVWLLPLLALAQLGQAQVQVRGVVRDRETQEVLPFASIAVIGTTNGTTSNLEGEFTLVVKELPAMLLVSELGHVRDTVRVTSAAVPLNIGLASAAVALPEVKVASFPFQLVDRAFRNLQRNYRRTYYGRAFYRQITRIDNEPIELQEVVWNVKSNPARIEGTTLAQGRYAAVPAAISLSNFSVYSRRYGLFDANQDSATSLALMSPNVEKNYLLELKGILGEDSTGGVAEISFETRPEVAYRAQGTVWIDIETNQIVRYRVVQPSFTGSTNNPRQEFTNAKLTIEMAFKEGGAAGVGPLELIKMDLSTDLTEPGKDPLAIKVSSFTYFYDQSTKVQRLPYARASLTDRDLAAIKAKPYDPEFWANNPVVKRTPAEDEVVTAFEKKGAFGSMVKKKK